MVKEQTGGEIHLPEGSLYPILHKMAEEGLVKMEKEAIGKRVRRYYSLTKAGTHEARFKLEEFERFVITMQQLLLPKTQGSEA